MIIPKNVEEISDYATKGNAVLFFTATWCGDCNFIKPQMPAIEAEFPDYNFVQIDRDQFLDVAVEMSIMGIPSFVVVKDGKTVGRLVNKDRKTKDEIVAFLNTTR